MKILFIYDLKREDLWKDGLWAALNLLEKDGFQIDKFNLQKKESDTYKEIGYKTYDFTLGWGGFNSPVDKYLKELSKTFTGKKGLCIGGNAFPPQGEENYDVLFYETDWYLPQIMHHKNVVHAFGVNTDIYKPIEDAVPIWDWVTVGSFSLWKRQGLLKNKGGYRLAIGEIQKENKAESMSIIADLLNDGIVVSDMVGPEKLAIIYNASEKVYIPADIYGGGERAVLEARACGVQVEVEYDNPKLKDLTIGPIWNHYYYFDQLKKGICSSLSLPQK